MNVQKSKTTKIFRAFAALFFTAALISPVNLSAQTAAVTPHRGMCYATWCRDRFASEHSDRSLERLREIGADHLSLVVTQYQDSFNSTEIKRTERTPSDRSLSHAIKTAKELGLTVMLKPHIDLIDKHDGSFWRADIGFNNDTDWARWFRNYRRVIIHYARLAERTGVEIFCVGTELSFTTQRNDEWVELIREVRKVFSGKLVYAANWDNFKNVRFWNELDYVGIDAYFPLSYSPDPTLEELKQGWRKWKNEIRDWHSTVNKPILFTELGYASTPSAHYAPWEGGMQGNPDIDIQAMCYEAFFQTIWNEPWFAGVYWWKWNPNIRSGGQYNRRFTPQNKPAERIIEAHYKGPEPRTDRIALAK